MYLTRMIYASRVSEQCTFDEIDRILATAREYNTKNGLTGLLVFTHEHFLQCLEGPRSKVNALYNHIANDPRHSDVTILEYAQVAARVFASWSMAYVSPDDLTHDLLLKHAPFEPFEPSMISEESSYSLFLDLKDLIKEKRKLT